MRAVGAVLAAAGASATGFAKIPAHATRQEKFEFFPTHEKRVAHHLYTDLTESSYLSPPLKLSTGEAWFSLPTVTVMPMPAPGKSWAIIAMKYDIIDETGRSMPLSEMYSHHWLVYDKLVGGRGDDMGCGGEDSFVSNIWGAGAEMRGIDYRYTEGYGYVSLEGQLQHWSANLHFIRLEDLDTSYFNGSLGAAWKSCVECDHVKGWNKGPECLPGLEHTGCGILACCFDGTRCPVNDRSDKTKKQYHLQYNVTWTTEVEKVKPVNIKVLDGFACEICSTVEANHPPKGTKCDDKYCVSDVEQKADMSGTILWAYTHQHIGAINSTLFVNGKEICTSTPIHGTDPSNAPGNELGWIVGFDMCIDTPKRGMSDALHVNKGDVMRIVSWYSVDTADNTALPIPGGSSHLGAMNLHYFVINPDDAPTPPQTYKCRNGTCTQDKSGVPLATCQAAC
jgi:hypothetical protein